jgi:hypothetical protein
MNVHRVADRSVRREADLKNWDAIVGMRGRISFGANLA